MWLAHVPCLSDLKRPVQDTELAHGGLRGSTVHHMVTAEVRDAPVVLGVEEVAAVVDVPVQNLLRGIVVVSPCRVPERQREAS